MYAERPETLTLPEPQITETEPRAQLMGVEVHRVTESQVVDHVLEHSRSGGGGSIYSVNLDTLRQAHQRPEIASLLLEADIRIADGMPIIWAGQLAGRPFPERVAGSNLVPAIAAKAAHSGQSLYLLGGNPGVADEAARILLEGHPGLNIAGTDCPEFGFEKSEELVQGIRDRAVSAQPDIIFVGLGFPKQEHLIEMLRDALPNAWFISCGISFSFLTGDVRRAPEWVQKLGLEWVHRFAQEPKRLFPPLLR